MQRLYEATPVARQQFTELGSEKVVALLKIEFSEEPVAINYTLYGAYKDMEATFREQQPGSYGWNMFVGFDPEIYWNHDKEYLCYSDPHIRGGFSIVKIQWVDAALLKRQFSL